MGFQDRILLMSKKSNLSHFCLGCLMPCQGETRSQHPCTEQNMLRAFLIHGPRVLLRYPLAKARSCCSVHCLGTGACCSWSADLGSALCTFVVQPWAPSPPTRTHCLPWLWVPSPSPGFLLRGNPLCPHSFFSTWIISMDLGFCTEVGKRILSNSIYFLGLWE